MREENETGIYYFSSWIIYFTLFQFLIRNNDSKNGSVFKVYLMDQKTDPFLESVRRITVFSVRHTEKYTEEISAIAPVTIGTDNLTDSPRQASVNQVRVRRLKKYLYTSVDTNSKTDKDRCQIRHQSVFFLEGGWTVLQMSVAYGHWLRIFRIRISKNLPIGL